MDRHEEIMKRGQQLYGQFVRHRRYTYCSRKFADPSCESSPRYILVETRFTTGHDDSAQFVELIDENEDILMSWRFDWPLIKYCDDPPFFEDNCLAYYLHHTLKLEVVRNTW